MAKRVTKTTNTSAKQTAATRRTKKTTTPTKKSPTKKAPVKKAPVKVTKKEPVKKTPTVTSGKKTVTKKGKTAKKTATTKKRTVKSGKNPTKKTTLSALAKEKAEILAKIKAKQNTKPTVNRKHNPKREYYVLPESGASEKFREMGEKVRLGEVKWAYYAIDNDIGYHHYEKLK